MSWDRTPVAAALVSLLTAATEGAVTVFPTPPTTFNPPALIVAYETSVRYNVAGFSIDEVELPLAVAAGVGDEDQLNALKAVARQAVAADPTLAGTVQVAYPTMERNKRTASVAGVEVFLVEVVLEIHM